MPSKRKHHYEKCPIRPSRSFQRGPCGPGAVCLRQHTPNGSHVHKGNTFIISLSMPPTVGEKKKALCALICEWVGFLTWRILNPGPLDSARRWKGERREEAASLYSLTSFLDLIYTSSSRRLPRTPVRWRPGTNAALGGAGACSLTLVLYRGKEHKANVASVLLYI